MIPLAGLMPGIPELLIILAVVLLLFGGSRLAGLGKSTGRAIKEFKDETKGLKGEQRPATPPDAAGTAEVQQAPSYPAVQAPQGHADLPVQTPETDVTNPADRERR